MAEEADLKPVYLIISDQRLLVDEAVERLKRRVGDAADLDFNMQVFEGENASGDDIVVACNTLPFAAERRLVIVKAVEKLSKDVSDALVAYTTDPSPTAVLALTGEKLAKTARLYKAIEKLGGIVDRQVAKRDFPAHIRRMFESRGRNITPEAAEELVAAVGYNLRRLSVEVDKAVAFVGERTDIGLSDIEDVISTTATASVWEFNEALGQKDCRRALALALDLTSEGETVFGLHARAVWTLRDLISVRSLMDRGVSGQRAIGERIGKPDWMARRLMGQAAKFESAQLVSLLRAGAEAEAQMKTGRDPRLVLEQLIVKICG